MKAKLKAAVDVFPLISALRRNPNFQADGISRQIGALLSIQDVLPAIYEPSAETSEKELTAVANLIGCNIVYFRDLYEIANATKTWISLGVDQCAPGIHMLSREVALIAVLHDVMSYEGLFGQACKEQFIYGALTNQVFLPVSGVAFFKFKEVLLKMPVRRDKAPLFVHFGNIPRTPFLESSELGNFRRDGMLVVNAHHPRKNLGQVSALARHYGTVLRIVGFLPEDYPKLGVHGVLMGALRDVELAETYQKAQTFACLSSDEGFSMTPMEAILNGVPYVFVSDIPAHREIYGDLSVNFVTLPLDVGSLPAYRDLVTTTRYSRMRLSETHSPRQVLGNLVKFLNTL